MRRFRLIVEYDGSGFHGWQLQPGVRTVEGCVREAAERIANGPVDVRGASRTDSGVHARGQSVLVAAHTSLDAERFGRAIEALTPPDIGIIEARDAEPDFDPRRDALEKRYLYAIRNSRRAPVLSRMYETWIRAPLDVDAMHAAAQLLAGRHDFSAFRNQSVDPDPDPVRTLRVLDWQRAGDRVFFQVIGDAFLYRMVRNLAGTLLEVGRGRLTPAECSAILESRDRRRAGPTARPEGLYLMEVAYADTPRCRIERHDAPSAGGGDAAPREVPPPAGGR